MTFDWLFWKMSRCSLCYSSFKGGSHIYLKHESGISKLKICDICSATLLAEKSETLQNKTGVTFHDPMKSDENI